MLIRGQSKVIDMELLVLFESFFELFEFDDDTDLYMYVDRSSCLEHMTDIDDTLPSKEV